MAFISENDIEEACVKVLLNELHYNEHLNLWKLEEAEANQAFGRNDAQGVVRLPQLAKSLRKLNSDAPQAVLDEALKVLTQHRGHMTPFEANRAVTRLLQKGLNVSGIAKNEKGVAVDVRVRFMDFEKPDNNHFAVVQQLTIKGKATRRPDLLVLVNGLPLVFVELKNATEDTRQAYDKNLTDYRRDIGQLFDFNLVVVLSNTYVTKVGSHTADWEQFFNWEKISDEKEAPVPEKQIDLVRVMQALFRKETLLDLLENFVLFYADRAKIVAKNHQFLGVNNALAAFENREALAGKLGVFWHTQGSGKSFSMAYFVQKVRRKVKGGANFKFVLVTDRDDLEDQLYKTFVRSELLDSKQPARAQSGADLVKLVKTAAPVVFTLIQKFKSPGGMGGVFQALTERGQDYVVLVDEAHRSQYKDLGDNLRRAFRGASYLAFTGTPLLDTVETTKEWFGEYVSRYDYMMSVADGSTVPIFYHNRVPKMQLQNDALNDDYAEIVADENLTDEQQEHLTREYANVTTVITDNDRLDTLAQDIVAHFPGRGYLGKGMVISINKETTVKMYEKVAARWSLKIKELQGQLNALPKGSPQRLELERMRKWMKETEMTVIVSEEADENSKFDKLGLNLRPHRERMNKTYGDDHLTIEDRFRDPKDKFRLAFVCAKWLTGFDAQTVSTLYLDKPMQNHTLMQTIARANRVAVALDAAGNVATLDTLHPIGKTSGLVVDYLGVFTRLEKALAKYARPKQGGKADYPAEVFEDLLGYLEASIAQAVGFLAKQGLALDPVLSSPETFDKLTQFEGFADQLSKTEELKKEFSVYQTAVTSFYEACKPDILTEELLPNGPYRGRYRRTKDALEYLRRIISRQLDQEGNLDGAKTKADALIDEAIVTHGYTIAPLAQIDLTSIDLDKLHERFKVAPYKHLAISDMVDFLKERLRQLLDRNVTRVDLAQRLQDIIQQYNSVSSDVEAFFKALKEYAEKLQGEEKRAAAEGLSEEELELFDLLFQEKLTEADKLKVKTAAKHLLATLKANETYRTVMTPDWHKNPQLQLEVQKMLGAVLDKDLPDSYTKPVFLEKREAVYQHVYQQAARGTRYWA
jgi:type I restriction enzyme R subunit